MNISECDEGASTMRAPRFGSLQATRVYIRRQMPDESEQVVDNYAWSVYRNQQADEPAHLGA